ncbi:MAG TPA: MerC domain-containing protein [Bacteriovoracaceae bacterium]|nr:MerC domain-containing protein [Bacteriovoracaceae bacterium]
MIDVNCNLGYTRSMKKVWDRLGIAFSSACVVHCIMVAFLPFFFPAISVYTHSTWVHVIVGIIILFTSPLAFIPGYRKHGLTWIIGVAFSGLFLILLGILLEEQVSEQVSHGVSILGSLILVVAHVKNIQHSHRHQHQCC